MSNDGGDIGSDHCRSVLDQRNKKIEASWAKAMAALKAHHETMCSEGVVTEEGIKLHFSKFAKDDRKLVVDELKKNGLSNRQIAAAVGVNPATINRDVTAANAALTAANAASEKNPMENGECILTESAQPNVSGTTINVPNGKLVSEIIRIGMHLEKEESIKAEQVAKRIKISIRAYRVGRDIILLSDRDDLSPADKETVAKALRLMDETKQTLKSEEIIKPLALKIWGNKGHRATGDKKRSESFETAISVIVEICERAPTISIPYLTPAQVNNAVSQLKQAQACLRGLIASINHGGKVS